MNDDSSAPDKSFKIMRRMTDDPRIEVLFSSPATHQIEVYSFQASRIDHLEGTGAGKSTMVLISGATFTLSIPYKELVEKIEEGASPVDLTSYSAFTPFYGLEIGDKVEDGSIFAGISPDTKTLLLVAAEDAPSLMSFDAAARHAKTFEAHGQKGWCLPTPEELSQIFRSKKGGSLMGAFNLSSLYWTNKASPYSASYAYCADLSDGEEGYKKKDDKLPVRFVRHAGME